VKNRDQISHFLIPYKIRERLANCLTQYIGQSSALQVDVLDLKHVSKPKGIKCDGLGSKIEPNFALLTLEN